MAVRLKRIYDPASRGDGRRVLVDRMWPRGLKKQEAQFDEWLKEVAPSSELRKWFNHQPDKWEMFKQRYFDELDQHPEAVSRLKEWTKQGQVTLLFSARDAELNNAAALKEYLQRHRAH